MCLPERGLVMPDWTECEISGYGKDSECKQIIESYNFTRPLWHSVDFPVEGSVSLFNLRQR